jgi:endonuclease/exonuclease/phosphatase family metal-dependent hydrolase
MLSDEHKRVGLQADIETPGGILHVVSTHLLHTHHAPSELQASQARTLARVVPGSRTIVAGDFNALPESDAVRAVSESLRQTDPSLAPTWSMYPDGCTVCNPTDVTDRFDYIFATPDVVTRDPQVGQSDGSDHLPISVTIDA